MTMRKHKSLKTTMMYIALALLTIVSLFPLFWGLSASFRSDNELYKYALPFSFHTLIPVQFTFQSYMDLFIKYDFLRPMINTMVVIAVVIPLSLLVNSIAAFSFATFEFRFKKGIFNFALISFMIPFESIALPLYNVVDGFHMVDTRAGLVVPSIANGLVLFLFTQFFRDLPSSLIEAARVDGAAWPRVFISIVLPSSIPVIVTAALMTFMDQWNAYLWPLLVARSKEIRTIQIALSSFKMERVSLWSCLYAGSMISALIPLFLFLPFQKYYVQGITSSGIKG